MTPFSEGDKMASLGTIYVDVRPVMLPEPSTVYTFEVDGEPKAQPRPRIVRRGAFSRTYNPDTADDWKARVVTAARQVIPRPIDGPIRLTCRVYFPRLDEQPGGAVPHVDKPDADNLAKAIMDALTYSKRTAWGVWRDDTQVCCLIVEKWHHAQGERPGASIEVASLN